MIIRCPECASTYEISAATPVLGKKVRCSHCAHVWRVEAVEDSAPVEEADPPVPDAAASAEAAVDSSHAPAGESLASESVEAETNAGADPGSSEEEWREEEPAVPESEETARPSLAPIAAEPAASPFGRVAEARPLRQREDRYSLDPFEGIGGVAPPADARGGSGPSLAGAAGSGRSTAERRIERERAYSNGHAESKGEDPFRTAIPARGRERGRDASWGPEKENGLGYGYGDGQAGDGYDEPAAPGGHAMPQADGGLVERKRGSGLMVGIGWIAMLAALSALGAYAFFEREAVTRTLPGTVPLYASLGMPVNARGLEFRDVNYTWTVDGKGRPAIDVGGEIENVSGEPRMVPTVVFAFQDEEGLELFHWATPVRRSPLPPGKRSKFQARIPAPPEAVRNLQLRFARAQ